MTKMSKSFVFYLKNFDTMQALTGNDDSINQNHIKKLLEQSGLQNAEKIVDRVQECAQDGVLRLLTPIGDRISQKYGFPMMSRQSTIQKNWHIEHWMYEKRPPHGEGYVLKTEIYSSDKLQEDGSIGLITCSIYDTRAKNTIFLEKIFGSDDDLKKGHDNDDFYKNELPIFEIFFKEEEEEFLVENFTKGLSEILTQGKIKELSRNN